MKLLTYKKNLKESIPIISLMISLNLVLIFLITYLPFLYLIIPFILILPSALLASVIKKRYYLIYFFIALLLSFLISYKDITFSLIYFLPSLISGFIYGLFLDKKYDRYLLILISSLINFLLEYLINYLLYLLLDFNLFNEIKTLLNLIDNQTFSILFPSLILLYSFISNFISFISVSYFINRFNLKYINDNKLDSFFDLINSLFFILIIIFSFFNLTISYIFLILSTYIFIINLIKIYQKKNYTYFLINIAFIFINLILVIILFAFISILNSILLLSISPLLNSILNLIMKLLFYKRNIN